MCVGSRTPRVSTQRNTTVQSLWAGRYGQSVVRFANDVRLVWRNGKRYNKEGSDVWIAADKLAKAFEILLEKWVMGPWRAKRQVQPRVLLLE